MQDQHLPVTRRQLAERALEVDTLLRPRRRRRPDRRLRRDQFGPTRAAPHAVAAQVQPDARQPRRELRLPAELPQALHRADPALLHHVLRLGLRATQQPQHELVQPRRMAAVQLAERLLVAILEQRGRESTIGCVRVPASSHSLIGWCGAGPGLVGEGGSAARVTSCAARSDP